jgi:hypothetical protein
MVTNEVDVWNQIVALVKNIPSVGFKRVGRTQELKRQTDLVSDLGLVGDDAFEFMEKYASSLNVKKGDYDSSAYFDAEGLWLLPRFGKKKVKMHITLGMLELAAKEGEWNSAKLNRAYVDNAYVL